MMTWKPGDTLSRRSVLHGAGASLALPWLECMASQSGAADKAADIPQRSLFIGHVYGFIEEFWRPRKSGMDFDFPQSIKPLENFRNHLSIFSGLAHPRAKSIHGHSNYEYLTADAYVSKGGTVVYKESLDQLLARHLGRDTRYPSLQFAAQVVDKQALSYIDGAPLSPMRRPGDIFSLLFAADADSDRVRRQFATKKSVLDLVKGELDALHAHLGKADQQKIDQYISSVRDMEKRLTQEEAWSHVAKPQPKLSDIKENDFHDSPYNKDHAAFRRKDFLLFNELIALALQTDQTRILTHVMDLNLNTESEMGFKENYHSLTHSQGIPGAREKWARFELLSVEIFADLLARLQSRQEGDATLLDHTLVLFGSPNGEGGHSVADLPIMLCGNVDGKITHGRHHVYPGGKQRETPLSNLFVGILHLLGIEDQNWRDSNAPIDLSA